MLTGILIHRKLSKHVLLWHAQQVYPNHFIVALLNFRLLKVLRFWTFDYRGIHLSAPKQLKDFQMSYLDWGEHDLTGAIDRLKSDNLPLFMVGHSYGMVKL